MLLCVWAQENFVISSPLSEIVYETDPTLAPKSDLPCSSLFISIA